ncbi:hypothetical protein B0H16DRAFT_1491473 [Mycena metata]|uniref:F-box domain-containing protein n=1 Tax=Mycena metata TaxID=1033252 RepID=A0AAD7KEZ5_9AGAR|nr:hypothetical protein B0H16DRAFT_1491473 [Mycena metata]
MSTVSVDQRPLKQSIVHPKSPAQGGAAYPVLTLPHELTSEIFLRCLPPVPELSSDAKNGPNASLAPLLLLRICRTWRNVALSTPHLWVHLHLILADLPMDLDEVELERRVVDWFYRTGSCSLSFSVALGSPFVDGFGAEAIRAILRRHAPRLQTISLQLEKAHFLRLNSILGPFPALENLSLALPFNTGESGDASEVRALKPFLTAPRLQQLSYGDRARPRMFSLPYKRLSKVTCDALSGDEFLDLIQGATFLQELTCSVNRKAINFSGVPITHNHLRTLSLIYNSSTGIVRFLCLPTLETLHLSLDIPDSPSNLTFLAFLAHSSGSFFQYFFAALDRTEHSSFLPRLRALSFVDTSFDVTQPVIQALSSRCVTGDQAAALESFQLMWPRGFTAESLKESIIKGMLIHIGPAWKNSVWLAHRGEKVAR